MGYLADAEADADKKEKRTAWFLGLMSRSTTRSQLTEPKTDGCNSEHANVASENT